jgi:hypothetical protein
MKRFNILLIVFLAAMTFGSCSKDNDDNESINPVSNVSSTPFYGAVTLQWTNPTDADYYYTLITYKDTEGNTINKKVCVYDGTDGITKAIVGGFTDTNAHEFTLTAYSFQGGHSVPVTITGTPEASSAAKEYVLNTVKMVGNDAGAMVSWVNETGVAVTLYATYLNVEGVSTTTKIDATKTGSYQLNLVKQQDIAVYAVAPDGSKSAVKTFNVTPTVNPDDVVYSKYEYITFGGGANTVTVTQPESAYPYEFKFVCTSGDPYINSTPLTKDAPGSTLVFRYKADVDSYMEFFWCDPGGGAAGGREDGFDFTATSTWKTIRIALSDFASHLQGWEPKTGYFFRFDVCNTSGATIYIRNMHWE